MVQNCFRFILIAVLTFLLFLSMLIKPRDCWIRHRKEPIQSGNQEWKRDLTVALRATATEEASFFPPSSVAVRRRRTGRFTRIDHDLPPLLFKPLLLPACTQPLPYPFDCRSGLALTASCGQPTSGGPTKNLLIVEELSSLQLLWETSEGLSKAASGYAQSSEQGELRTG